jgi:hypothetical protein
MLVLSADPLADIAVLADIANKVKAVDTSEKVSTAF